MNTEIVKDLVVDVVDSQVEERLTLSRIPSDRLRCHVETDHLLGDIYALDRFADFRLWQPANWIKATAKEACGLREQIQFLKLLAKYHSLACSCKKKIGVFHRRNSRETIATYEVVLSACFACLVCDFIVCCCRVVHDKDLFHRSSGKKVGLCSKRLQQSERPEARGRQVRMKRREIEVVTIYIQTYHYESDLLCKTYHLVLSQCLALSFYVCWPLLF